MSWLGRGALANRHLDLADRYARETHTLAVAQIESPDDWMRYAHYTIALGAAIEVLAHVQVARNARSEAVAFLEREANTYRETSVLTRSKRTSI